MKEGGKYVCLAAAEVSGRPMQIKCSELAKYRQQQQQQQRRR